MSLQDKTVGDNQMNMLPFSLDQPEYDQGTFLGRFKTLVKVQNPFNTFARKSVIENYQRMIEKQRQIEDNAVLNGVQTMLPKEKIDELRKAKYVVDSSVHPDTKEIIKPFQRFCSYSFVNIPILFGMIISRQTTANIVLWQWVNQTYNAILNYSNRNASSSMDMKGLSTAYIGAVTTSIGIGLGMRRILTPYASRFRGPAQMFFNFLINVTAIGCAGVLNVLIMRSKELSDGITLTDSEGNDMGRSPKIGKDAVLKTAFSRIILPIPPLLLPTVAFYLMEKRNLVPKNKVAKILTETAIFFSSMAFAPPLCCAIFEQTSKVHVSKLEPHFHNLKDKNGRPIEELYYNKGL
jgi:tricarboxylate carrier